MTLILTNHEIENLFTMQECLESLERMYKYYANNEAKEVSRVDSVLPYGIDMTYNFKSMIGVYPPEDVIALRVNSDMIKWSNRREKLPLAPGGRWVGLIFLFSIKHTNLLAIIQDGLIQSFRVGATTALGAKYLAKSDAKTYGLIGTGQQASGQIEAISQVRQLETVKVFSPNVSNRRSFANLWREKLGINVVAVDSAEDAVEGSDIVGCATNSTSSVVKGEWLRPGMHVTCIRGRELAESVYKKVDKCFVHNLEYTVNPPYEVIGSDSINDIAKKDLNRGSELNRGHMFELKDLIGGTVPGRIDNTEITCFYNNIGIALQFAAVASLAYSKAKQKGRGHKVSDDWFCQDFHS